MRELALRRLRFRALGTLVGVAMVAAAVALTIAYPQFGMALAEGSGGLYFPPQAWVAGIVAPIAIGFGVAAAQDGTILARQAWQGGWRLTFLVLLPLQVLVPGYLIGAFFSALPRPPDLQFDDWLRLAYVSVGVLTGCGLLALAYSWRGAREVARA